MALARAVAAGPAGIGYSHARRRDRGSVTPRSLGLAVSAVPVALAPDNPTSGPAPSGLVAAFPWVTASGLGTPWYVTTSVHASPRGPNHGEREPGGGLGRR